MKTTEEIVKDSRKQFEEELHAEDFGIEESDEKLVERLTDYVISNSAGSFHVWLVATSLFIFLDEYGKSMLDEIESNPEEFRNKIQEIMTGEDFEDSSGTQGQTTGDTEKE